MRMKKLGILLAILSVVIYLRTHLSKAWWPQSLNNYFLTQGNGWSISMRSQRQVKNSYFYKNVIILLLYSEITHLVPLWSTRDLGKYGLCVAACVFATKLNSSLAKYLFFTGLLLAWCWERTSFHFYEQLLLKTCGDAELNSFFAAVAPCFSLGLLGSDRLLKSSEMQRAGSSASLCSSITSWSFTLAPSAQWEALGLNHVLCTIWMVSLYWLLLAQLVGRPCLDQAEKLLLFPFWDCRKFLTFFNSLQWCLSRCQMKHCHICSLFCLSPHLCRFSLWCFGFLPEHWLPLLPFGAVKTFLQLKP